MSPPPSPCVTCVSDAPCPCPAFMAWEDLTHPAPRECLTCVDADLLLLSGEHFDQVCARLGILRASLITHLHRHGRTDLLPKQVAL